MLFKHSSRKKRSQEILRFAYEIDADYTERDDFGQLRLFKDFQLFRQGHSRRIINLIRKWEAHEEINMFDYHYVIQAGNTPVAIKQTVFFVKSNELALPQFLMKPETFFLKVGQWLGMEDIDFEEFPNFSQKYWLKGEHESMIRSNFNQDILKFFSLHHDWYLEGLNYYLILYKKNKILPLTEVRRMYQHGMYLFQKFRTENETTNF